jgi:hypothetical protein
MAGIDELKKELLSEIASRFMMTGIPKEEYQVVQKEVETLIAVAYEKGAAEEREKLAKHGYPAIVLHGGGLLVGDAEELTAKYAKESHVVIVAASALSQKNIPEEERGL